MANLHSLDGTSLHLATQNWHAVTAFDRLGVAVDEVMTDESEFAGDLAGAWLGARSGDTQTDINMVVSRLP